MKAAESTGEYRCLCLLSPFLMPLCFDYSIETYCIGEHRCNFLKVFPACTDVPSHLCS